MWVDKLHGSLNLVIRRMILTFCLEEVTMIEDCEIIALDCAIEDCEMSIHDPHDVP